MPPPLLYFFESQQEICRLAGERMKQTMEQITPAGCCPQKENGLSITTLASGSSGNSILICSGETRVLVDAGISCRRIKCALAQLELTPADLAAVLITHEHSDHISGLATLFKQYRLPVWCSEGTARQLAYRIAFLEQVLHSFRAGEPFRIGDLEITGISTCHDAADPVCYIVSDAVHKAAVVTDLGCLTRTVLAAVEGCDILVAEANHDVDLLRSGPYPYYLKQRILGEQGHLSNELCAQLVSASGAGTVVLAHLSAENNLPSLALQAVREAVGDGVTVEVAPRCEMGRRYVL